MSLLFRDAWNTPWKLRTELRRRLASPFVRFYLLVTGVEVGPRGKFFGVPLVQRHRQGSIRIGSDVAVRGWSTSNPLVGRARCVLSVRAKGAEIVIGNSVGMTSSVIVSERSVRIGDRVRLGADTVIVDTDFHPLSSIERLSRPTAGRSSAIVIEDDVFIGMRSIVLKGTRIRRGAVIGAGSVVSGDIPANTVCAGNPARVVRGLDR